MIAKINIHGQIGPSSVDEAGLFHKGVQLLDVIEQVPPDATEFEVSINSPGGYVDIGDAIYNYLNSLKKKGKVTTIQDGLVGSIATKIFLAGDERLVDDRFQFWIHNPFKENVSGDSDELMAMAKGLEATETELRQFYMGFTKIDESGLDALMKVETGLTADQCIKFGFATGKKSVPVLNIIKPTMKEEKSFMEHVKAFFTDKPKGVQPKAQVPGNPAQKSMVVNLADGAGSFWVEGEGVAEGVAAFLLDEAGQPTSQSLADGDYALEDGSVISVMGGKVAKLTAKQEIPMEDEEEMIPKSQVEAMVKSAVEQALAPKLAEFEKEKESAIMALKKSARIGVQPTKAALGLPDNQPKGRTIASVMRDKREERSKQLNKN